MMRVHIKDWFKKAYTHTTFFPCIKFITTTITAITSRIWINPPKVVDVTIPRSHRTIKIVAIVHNMTVHPFFFRRISCLCCTNILNSFCYCCILELINQQDILLSVLYHKTNYITYYSLHQQALHQIQHRPLCSSPFTIYLRGILGIFQKAFILFSYSRSVISDLLSNIIPA